MSNENLAQMTNENLAQHIKDLKALRFNANQMRNAPQFGRLDRQLEAAWREEDRRR